MTDLIELAQRVCMGEYVPPLKDGISPQVAFDAMFAPMQDQLAELGDLARKIDAQSRKIAEAARKLP
jgi:hypothetical protein